MWQLRRLVFVLNEAGYDVTALDYPKSVLSKGDASLLPTLVDEVSRFADDFAREKQEPVMLVGVSLGALLALNVVRSSPLYRHSVLITGGDIAKIARNLYPKKWTESYDDLALKWQTVNMYSTQEQLRGKRLLFVVHPSKFLIDTDDIYTEVSTQNEQGNTLYLVERKKYDHFGTIIEETIVHPERVLDYIAQVTAP